MKQERNAATIKYDNSRKKNLLVASLSFVSNNRAATLSSQTTMMSIINMEGIIIPLNNSDITPLTDV